MVGKVVLLFIVLYITSKRVNADLEGDEVLAEQIVTSLKDFDVVKDEILELINLYNKRIAAIYLIPHSHLYGSFVINDFKRICNSTKLEAKFEECMQNSRYNTVANKGKMQNDKCMDNITKFRDSTTDDLLTYVNGTKNFSSKMSCQLVSCIDDQRGVPEFSATVCLLETHQETHNLVKMATEDVHKKITDYDWNFAIICLKAFDCVIGVKKILVEEYPGILFDFKECILNK